MASKTGLYGRWDVLACEGAAFRPDEPDLARVSRAHDPYSNTMRLVWCKTSQGSVEMQKTMLIKEQLRSPSSKLTWSCKITEISKA
eukprot:1153872-Pelagomonas_calceolata.AAC.2